MKKKIIALCAVFLLLPSMALAADFRSSESSLTIGAKETPKNLYVAGKDIRSDAKILGDFLAAGNSISVNEKVENEFMAVGQDIYVEAPVGRSSRLAGANINIKSSIGEDLFAVGDTIRISKDAVIGGDLVVAASSVIIDGKVTGNVHLVAAELTVNGQVSGDVNAYGLNTLVVGDNAKIDGRLKYASTKEGTISSSAVIAKGVDFNKIEKSQWSEQTSASGTIGTLLISLLTVLIMVYLLPKWSAKSVQEVYQKPLNRALWGLFTLFVIPFISILLMVTILGIKIGLFLLLLYILFLLAASILTPLIAGSVLYKLFKKESELRIDWATVLIGVLVLTLVALVPLIGGLIVFIFFLTALGQLSIGAWEFSNTQRN